MGWLFSERWPTRRDLINAIVSTPQIQSCKALRHCCTGNNLWVLNEVVDSDNTTHRFITLYMLQKHGGTYPFWGYKDIEETCGPVALTCPISYIDACTEPANDWSREWREKVRARHAATKQKLKIGDQFTFCSGTKNYEVVLDLPNSYGVIEIETGNYYRLKRSQLSLIQLVKKEVSTNAS